jgi:hypothetical protein
VGGRCACWGQMPAPGWQLPEVLFPPPCPLCGASRGVEHLEGTSFFMIYSRPRYWIQTMLPPNHFQKHLSQDVHHLVWAKEHDFERSEKGSTTVAKPWIRKQAIHNPKRTKNHAPNVGLGLIDWGSHCKSIRVRWILNYLNASQGP